MDTGMTIIKLFVFLSVIGIVYLMGFNKGYNDGYSWGTKQEQENCQKELKSQEESGSCPYKKK